MREQCIVGVCTLMLSASASQALSDAEFTDFLRTECGKGHVERCWLYGGQLERGKGTHQNDTEAAKVYDHACEQGLGEACHALAILVQDGKGVEQNVTKAIELYTRTLSLLGGIGHDPITPHAAE